MKRRSIVILAVALAVTACEQGTNLSPTLPPVLPATITETFNGTVAVKGLDSHNFKVTAAGQIAITLTTVSPTAVVVGLGLGVPSGLTCVMSLGDSTRVTVEPAPSPPQISGTALTGTFCVAVYDVGNLTTPSSYSVTVDHS